MKDLNKLYKECIKECDDTGIEYGNIVSIKENSRYTRKWGYCSFKNNEYSIQISSRLLKDDVSDEAAKNTIMHEILHTVKGCLNHGPQWKAQAAIINNKYNFYNIKRTTSNEEKCIKETNDDYKYVFKCKNCNSIVRRQRDSRFVKYYKSYRCGKCHVGIFEKIK